MPVERGSDTNSVFFCEAWMKPLDASLSGGLRGEERGAVEKKIRHMLVIEQQRP